MHKWIIALLAATLGAGWIGMAGAQSYPVRPIAMIVPFPPGGATDTLARYLAEEMRPILGQSIIIENVAGAAGSIGVGRAVRSPADGYTLSIGTSTTHMLTGGLYALAGFGVLAAIVSAVGVRETPAPKRVPEAVAAAAG